MEMTPEEQALKAVHAELTKLHDQMIVERDAVGVQLGEMQRRHKEEVATLTARLQAVNSRRGKMRDHIWLAREVQIEAKRVLDYKRATKKARKASLERCDSTAKAMRLYIDENLV
jgi:hypothetical protein